MKTTKSFQIQNKINTVSSDNDLFITGVANTGNEDLAGDIITIDALKQIAEQIPYHNLHIDHGTEIKDILGPLIEGSVTDRGLEYKARIINEKKDFISSLLNQGVNLGSSISGTCEYEKDSDKNIIEWNLTEISLTGIPCDQGTMATVQQSKSFDNIINELNKKGDENMAEENTAISKEDVIQIVNDALNEQKEEMAQSLRDELAKEFVTGEQLKEVVDKIKEDMKPEEKPSEEEKPEEKSGDEETTTEEELACGDDEEQKSGTEDEEKPSDDKPSEEKPEDKPSEDAKPEDEKEDAKKYFDAMIQKQVNNQINGLFKSLNSTPENNEFSKSVFDAALQREVDARIDAIFKGLNNEVNTKYDAKAYKQSMEEENKTYTPEEIARML